MFENLTTPTELFRFQLGSALEMEQDSLRMLGELENAAMSDDLKQQFSHHADETRQQIENLNQAFLLLNLEPGDKSSPTTKGMEKQAESLLKKSDAALHDEVVISAALGTEHYEIATYRSLITSAEALGVAEVAELLRANLEQEEHTSKELEEAGKRHAMMA